MRRGEFTSVKNISNPACYAFLRKSFNDKVLIIMNTSNREQTILIAADELGWDDKQKLVDLINPSKEYFIANRMLKINLPAWCGIWLA